ncbi:MAG: redoxin domain-containing protein [Bacteroides sp.]|jgi:peroxiredoxin (alkyl hydroperoxide reductase subunit C)|nr:redoxin domain-containing protein [Bacteroides sp.]
MKRIILFTFILLFITFNTAFASNPSRSSIPLIGDPAPSFVAETTHGTLHFPEDYGRNWKILLAHPRDFTPVCSSEILELAYLQRDFEMLGAKLVVVSTDALESHFLWKEALEEVPFRNRPPVKINFPLVEDEAYVITDLYGMTHPEAKRGKNIRGVFLIDRDNKVRAMYFYPAETGRNMDEIKRTLMALQKTDDDFNVMTPANWEPGDPVMIPFTTPVMEEYLHEENSLYFQYNWFMTYSFEPKGYPLEEQTTVE